MRSGEDRVRHRALGELRGEAEVGGRGRWATWDWLRGHGVECGLYPTSSTWEPSGRILLVETFCDFMTLLLASIASIYRPFLSPIAPPPMGFPWFPSTTQQQEGKQTQSWGHRGPADGGLLRGGPWPTS